MGFVGAEYPLNKIILHFEQKALDKTGGKCYIKRIEQGRSDCGWGAFILERLEQQPQVNTFGFVLIKRRNGGYYV